MLTQSLRLLEDDGMIERIAHQVVPPHVDYRLTPMGAEVARIVLDLAQCIEANLEGITRFRNSRLEARPGNGS
jgi:DNA-binding HxlR family transcriptional regulator